MRAAFLWFLFFSTFSLAAQRSSASRPIFSHQYTFQDDPLYYFIDTAFTDLRYYRQWNNAYRENYGQITLTNIGGARNNVTFAERESIWQNFNHGPYAAYFDHRHSVPYYDVKSAYAEGKYWDGYDRGQVFKFIFTQNINPHWNFLTQIQRLNSLGLYNHNQNLQTRLLFSTRYAKPNGKYEAHFYALSENLEVDEFGGLASDSAFLNNEQPDRLLMNVNLRNNTTTDGDFRQMRNSELYLDQRVNFLQLWADTAAPDSVEKPALYLGHTFSLQNMDTRYVGDAQGNTLYTNFFNSRGAFTDSVHFRDVENTIYLRTEIGQRSRLTLQGGLRHLYTEYGGAAFSFSGNNVGVNAHLRGTLRERISLQAQGDWILAGPLSGALDLRGTGQLKLTQGLSATGRYRLQRRKPDFYSQYFDGNSFRWQRNFEFITSNTLQYGLAWGEENRLLISNHLITNQVYYDNEGLPAQTVQEILYLTVDGRQNFTFWNWLHLDQRITYQNAAQGAAFLPLPEWVARQSTYADFALFQRALLGIIGFEINYFSRFASPSYNPGTGRFFLAQERAIGDFPVLDVFAQFKIKKGKIFFKYEHANQGLLGYDTFAAPGYPIPDAVFRVGLMWRFFE